MEYKAALIAVKSVDVSKRFYMGLFEQKVVADFGKNVCFSGGFAIQEDFEGLMGLPEGTTRYGNHDMELYFEVEDFDGFMKKLEGFDVSYVHSPKTYEWKQRVVRVYDPDMHIVEIGESMAFIAKRYLSEGFSAEETAALIQHPLEFVKSVM